MTISPGTILFDRNFSWRFIPQHRRFNLDNGKQFSHSVRSAALLPKPEQAADEDDGKNDKASTGSCQKNDNPVAKIRIRIIGLLNWDTSRVKTFERFWGFRRLAP